MRKLLSSLPGARTIKDWLRPRLRQRRRLLAGKSREEVFTTIYEQELWDASESASGAGSTLETTRTIREELPRLLSSLGVRSLLDAPCGDFHWMSRVELDLDSYVGGEIVQTLVDKLNEEFGREGRSFVHLDVTCDPLPETDAFLCRDCLLHLSNAEVQRVLDNSLRSSCRYLIASTYPECAKNIDIQTGFARSVNLCIAPFDLPEPQRLVADPGAHVESKCLGVWDLDELRRGATEPAGA